MLSCFSQVQLFATPWAAACQTPLSMGVSRQEFCSWLPCLLTGFFPTQEECISCNMDLLWFPYCRQILYCWATREAQLPDEAFFIPESRSYIVWKTSRTTEAPQQTTWGQIKAVQAQHTPRSLSAIPPLNNWYNTSHQIPPAWDIQFWRH